MFDPVVLAMLLVLAVVGLVSLVLALRNRLPFRIAMRNVRRGRYRTVLLVLGLLIGTTIISASLVVGDSVDQLSLQFTYNVYGYTTVGVYNQSAAGYAYFPYSVYPQLAANFTGDAQVAGTTPEIVDVAQIYDRTTGIPQTNLNLIGVNANQSGQLGSFVADNGTPIGGPASGAVLLDDAAASNINASVGDRVILYSQTAIPAVVQAVVKDDTRGSFLNTGSGGGNAFVNLATAQQLANQSGWINFIAITAAGTLSGGVANSATISARSNATLAGIQGAIGLSGHPILAENLAVAQSSGASLTTLFLVLGLFSVAAGAMLIVGIFVMLAEERKGEMGMLRAIGLKRRDLVLTYYFEGLAYSTGSALAGVALGVVAGFVLIYESALIFTSGGLSVSTILRAFTVTTRSLVISYVAGFLLTLVTVTAASGRASRLNIVRAIRNIPEPRPPMRLYTYLAYVGAAILALGLLIYVSTAPGTGDVSYPIIGGGMVIIGAALLATRFVPNRYAFSAAGIAFIVWGGAEPLHQALLGSQHSGGIFVLFVLGIQLIFGAVLLYIYNATYLVRFFDWALGRRPQRASVVRIGLSYPSRRATRSAITLTIFALVIFTLVSIASFGASIQAGLEKDVLNESGGYTFFGFSNLPIPNLLSQIRANGTLSPMVANAVPLISGGVSVFATSYRGAYPDGLYAPPSNATGSASFYATNQFPFAVLPAGESAATVWQRLATNPSVAVVDNTFQVSATSFGPTVPHPTAGIGDRILLNNPRTNGTTTVTVIGILSESFINGVFVNPAIAAQIGYRNATSYFLTVSAGASPTHAAQALKDAFFAEGLVLLNFRQLISSSLSTTESFIGLLETFIALGLAVGIAAMGIVALRAVVERRTEIGMLRATGFTRGMILRTFFLEYSFVTVLGIVIGSALATLTNYGLAQSASSLVSFAVPWLTIGLIGAVAYLLALLAIIGPSVRAARLPPAEAVRPIE